MDFTRSDAIIEHCVHSLLSLDLGHPAKAIPRDVDRYAVTIRRNIELTTLKCSCEVRFNITRIHFFAPFDLFLALKASRTPTTRTLPRIPLPPTSGLLS